MSPEEHFENLAGLPFKPPQQPEVYALVDCNNFYVSCERVFRPDLENKPVIVMSNNDGCAVARSNEVKALGIKMGVPIFQIRDLVEKHHIRLFSSNYTLYGDMSQRVMDILQDFAPQTEVYSIDEAFLRLSDYMNYDLNAYGRKIRARIKQWTGIPTCVGIAETKTLSKLANHIAKKDKTGPGVFNLLTPENLARRDEILESVPVEDLWGVGPAHTRRLNTKGIRNARELRDMDTRWVRKNMTIVGLRMIYELRGYSCIPLELAPPPKKEICVSRAFGKRVDTFSEMREAVASYTTRACEKLRKAGRLASGLRVFIRTDPFRKHEPGYGNSVHMQCLTPTDDTRELLQYAFEGLQYVWKEGYSYKKCGVMLCDLVEPGQVQLDMYHSRDFDRSRRLSDALGAINQKHGRGALQFASMGLKQKTWQTQFKRRSPRYTTRWEDLPVVGA